ncbi:MAG: hypothetical protein ACRDD7_09305, partial [Peptostreptococcaceae bacterium]
KSIEEELGFSIFTRSRSGVELTPKGFEFIKYAENIRSNMKQISNIGKNKIDNTLLKFNISSQLFSYTLDTFFDFHSKYSNLHTEFKLEFCNCLDGMKNVYDKNCEIAFIYIHNDYIKLEDLYDSTLVLYDNYSDSSLYKELCKNIKFDEFKNKIVIYDYYSYFNTIQNKDVFSFVPIFDKFTSKSYTKSVLNLRNIPFDDMPVFTFGYLKHSNAEISDMSYEFIELLRREIGY